MSSSSFAEGTRLTDFAHRGEPLRKAQNVDVWQDADKLVGLSLNPSGRECQPERECYPFTCMAATRRGLSSPVTDAGRDSRLGGAVGFPAGLVQCLTVKEMRKDHPVCMKITTTLLARRLRFGCHHQIHRPPRAASECSQPCRLGLHPLETRAHPYVS